MLIEVFFYAVIQFVIKNMYYTNDKTRQMRLLVQLIGLGVSSSLL